METRSGADSSVRAAATEFGPPAFAAAGQLRFDAAFGATAGLRFRPETLWMIAGFSEHEAKRGKAQGGERFEIEVFPILGQPSAAIEPCQGALEPP